MQMDVEASLEGLEKLPGIVRKYFSNIPPEVLDLRRKKDAWTIREHLYHIVSVQDMLLKRIEKIRDEEHPVITPYFPEKQADQDKLYSSVEEALAEYQSMRKRQLDVIKVLPEAAYARAAIHPEYTSYSIPIIISHMVFHENWHMYRIEELWLTRDEFLS